MSTIINPMTISTVNMVELSFNLELACVIMLSIFMILKLLSAAAANNTRFAYVLNLAINAPMVSFMMAFAVIAVIRIIVIINQ